jgi:hypothetical protein
LSERVHMFLESLRIGLALCRHLALTGGGLLFP